MSYEGVSLDAFKSLRSRMRKMNVYEKDIVEQFVRSSGPGGQNINKVSTCVILTHRPTGNVIKCQMERTQGRNRYQARCLLLEKISHDQEKFRRQKIHEEQKLRRQKRTKTKKSKEFILEQKRKKSQLKQNRHTISMQNIEKYL